MQRLPTLSILIPVYNWDVTPLVGALTQEVEAQALTAKVEVIIGDDGSSAQFREQNRNLIGRTPWLRYEESAGNVGRSRMRNRLISLASSPWLLLLDADMLPDRPDFLRRYLRAAEDGHAVVCGGISYRQRILDGHDYDFYVYKGRRSEALSAQERQAAAWRYLFTGNVLVPRAVLAKVSFDERFSGYGYEDVEWAIRLERVCPLRHIDNTCSHLGLIGRKEAFDRMRQAVANFHRLRQLHPDRFAEARVAALTAGLERLPRPTLTLIDRLLSGLYRMNPGVRASYLCFQLDKAALLALAAKEQGNNR